jgi:hypothetical protein
MRTTNEVRIFCSGDRNSTAGHNANSSGPRITLHHFRQLKSDILAKIKPKLRDQTKESTSGSTPNVVHNITYSTIVQIKVTLSLYVTNQTLRHDGE